jgi:hypothetical protein
MVLPWADSGGLLEKTAICLFMLTVCRLHLLSPESVLDKGAETIPIGGPEHPAKLRPGHPAI